MAREKSADHPVPIKAHWKILIGSEKYHYRKRKMWVKKFYRRLRGR